MAKPIFNDKTRAFLEAAGWSAAIAAPLSGDASARKYFRLWKGKQSVVLMDASQVPETVTPFIRIAQHLQKLGFSAPAILARDDKNGLLLLEDFGDDLFSRLLDKKGNVEQLFTLATDVLIALHKHPQAVPPDLRAYHPEKMLEDIELFLEWHPVSETGKAEFRTVWQEILPVAHQVPTSLLLRDYHLANLMMLPERKGIRQAGLLDFQDAYQGPVTYDLVSLLEDARYDVPEQVKGKMLARYLAQLPKHERDSFETSMAILAALRHTRVLAIFERLSRHEKKHDYKKLHSPRVERLLHKALCHPTLAGVKRWMERHVFVK